MSYASPLESLPHTVFPNDNQYQSYQYTPISQEHQQPQQQQQHVNYPPPPPPRTCFSPQLTRDHYQASDDENASLQYQVSNYKFYFISLRFLVLVKSN